MTATTRRLFLGIDSVSRQAAVSLADGDAVLVLRATRAAPARGETLAGCIRDAFDEIGAGIAELAAIAVATGPGSYTGARVGIALASGLALPRKLPVFGVNSLELSVLCCPRVRGRVCAVLPTNGSGFYAACYEALDGVPRETLAPRLCSPEELGALLEESGSNWLLVGEGAQNALESWPSGASDRPLVTPAEIGAAAALAITCAAKLESGPMVVTSHPKPLYLAGSGARPNRNRVVAHSLGGGADT